MQRFLNISDTYSLRGLAMLMIIISHTFNGYPYNDAAYYFPSWIHGLHLYMWGNAGVAVFLFLSGYGLFITLNQKNIDKKYILSKVKRLLLPFIIYWIVEIIVLLIFNRQEISPHLFKEIATLSIHPDVENWFFKVIVVIYVVTLLIFKCRISNPIRIAILFILAFAYIFIMKDLGFGQWWYDTILCFPIGAIFAHRYKFFASLSPLYISCLAGALLIVSCYFHMNTAIINLIFILFCIYVIRIVNINNRILCYIGFNSFIFYFIECPVMDEITKFSYYCFPLYCVLSILVTYAVSYLCIEIINRKDNVV